MIDLSNLYANMTAICEHAALHELEIMLRVLRNRLERMHPQVGGKLTEGLELLDAEITRKRGPAGWPHNTGTARGYNAPPPARRE